VALVEMERAVQEFLAVAVAVEIKQMAVLV
jgi:hypothetical protein